ncbi:hypothetical protein BH10ACI1_BH10ACI1_04140 [soil metagenome]
MIKQNSSKKISRLRLTAALFLVCQFALGTIVGQSPSPSKSLAANANDEPKLTAGNVDTSKHPTTTVNFTIEKEGSVFRQLETKDVEVLLDGQKVELKPDALQKAKDSESVKVLFVIDKSKSMIIGVDKLQAAKDAIRTFVNNLSAVDEIAFSTFGEDYAQGLSLTKVENKSAINQALDGIAATDNFTNFYDSVQKAVDQADRAGIKNIIFLSDGKEDNTDFNALKNKNEEKSRREKDLSGKLNQKGVRFFAVAIGDPEADSSKQEFVDYDSMKNIAVPTQGTADLVNLKEINAEANGDKEKSKTLIADKLKGQLAEIKKALKFSYALVFDLPKNSKSNGEMLLNFNITDGNKIWKQSTTYPYTVKDGKPIFEKARVLPFILSSAAKDLSYGNLSLIYLLMLIPLAFLSGIPAVFNKFAAAAEVRKVNEAIVSLNRGSPFIGTQCPNESGPWGKRYAFNEGDTLIVCPQCGTPHHLACWADNKFQCMKRTCESRYQIPAQVLTKHNVQV